MTQNPTDRPTTYTGCGRFGPAWPAAAATASPQVDTPVGEQCQCGDPIAEGDRGWVQLAFVIDDEDGELYSKLSPVHAECQLLGIIGHDHGVCSCTGYDTSRASARLLWERAGFDPAPATPAP